MNYSSFNHFNSVLKYCQILFIQKFKQITDLKSSHFSESRDISYVWFWIWITFELVKTELKVQKGKTEKEG